MAVKLEAVQQLPMRYKVASIVRKAILAGEYFEGEELSLTALSQQLGVSRTPIREAFQMLEEEGLISLRPNKGAIVKGISEKTIKDHFDTRIVLEGECAYRAAEKKIDVTGLIKMQNDMEEAGNTLDLNAFKKYNQAFHMLIWQAADNEKILSIVTSLWNGSSFGKTVKELAHCMQSVKEHRAILEAVRNADAEGAKKAMQAHLIRSMNNILDSYTVSKQ